MIRLASMTPCTIRKEFEEFKEFRSSGVQEFSLGKTRKLQEKAFRA
jgi:hypothetical protein